MWLAATESAQSVPLAAVASLLPDGELGTDRFALFRRPGRVAPTRAGGVIIAIDDTHLLFDRALRRVRALPRHDGGRPGAADAPPGQRHARRHPRPVEGRSRSARRPGGAPGGRGGCGARGRSRRSDDGIVAPVVPRAQRGQPVGAERAAAGRPVGPVLGGTSGGVATGRRPALDPAAPRPRATRLRSLDTGHRRALELVALGEPVPRSRRAADGASGARGARAGGRHRHRAGR